MSDKAFEDWHDYVNVAFENRGAWSDEGVITVLEVGTTEFWVESEEGRFAIGIESFDRNWKPYVRLPKVGELWRRRNPYQGCCEILAVADDYVVYTYDTRRDDPVSARSVDNFLRNYESR